MFLVLGLAAVLCSAASPARALPKGFIDIPLDKLGITLKREPPGIGGDEITILCQLLNTGCGVEIVPLDEDNREPTLWQLPPELATKSPRQILDAYVHHHPEYQWALRDGVINLEPASRSGEDWLSRKLKRVSVHGVTGFKAILDIFADANIPFTYQIMGHPPRFLLLDLELRDVTVREAMNAVVKADPEKMWTVWYSTRGSGRLNFAMPSWRKNGAPFSREEAKTIRFVQRKK